MAAGGGHFSRENIFEVNSGGQQKHHSIIIYYTPVRQILQPKIITGWRETVPKEIRGACGQTCSLL